MTITRRTMLSGTAALLGTAALGGAHAQGGEIVFCGTGGSWQDNARKAWLQTFTQATGIKVVDVFPYDLGKLSTMVQTGNVEWDVTDMPSLQIGTAVQRGLLEPLDYGVIRTADLPKASHREHFVTYGYFSTGIVVNTKRFPEGKPRPASWADFWDVQRFPGPRAMRKSARVQLEFALLADGVAPDKLYPLDVERAFRKLDQIKPHVRVWWSSGAQSVQVIADGEADLGVVWQTRVVAAREQGVPIDFVWDQAALASLTMVVPKGARNKTAAMRLLDHILSADGQARMASFNGSAPVNEKAFPGIEPKIARDLSTYPQNRAKQWVMDEFDYWGQHYQALEKRFEDWLVRG